MPGSPQGLGMRLPYMQDFSSSLGGNPHFNFPPDRQASAGIGENVCVGGVQWVTELKLLTH